jgi:hypothetical protein
MLMPSALVRKISGSGSASRLATCGCAGLKFCQLVVLRAVGAVGLVAHDDLELAVAVEVGGGGRDAPVLAVELGRVRRVAEEQVALVVEHLPAEQDLRRAVGVEVVEGDRRALRRREGGPVPADGRRRPLDRAIVA